MKNKVIERLNASRLACVKKMQLEGEFVGTQWAMHFASYEQLIKMQMIVTAEGIDNYYQDIAEGGINLWEKLAIDIDCDDLETDAPEYFWINQVGLSDEFMSDEFVLAFIVGALEVLEEYQRKSVA